MRRADTNPSTNLAGLALLVAEIAREEAARIPATGAGNAKLRAQHLRIAEGAEARAAREDSGTRAARLIAAAVQGVPA